MWLVLIFALATVAVGLFINYAFSDYFFSCATCAATARVREQKSRSILQQQSGRATEDILEAMFD